MELTEKENERWYCRYDDTVILSEEDLHKVWRQRAELRGSYVVLFDIEKSEERTVEAISRENNKLDDAFHYGSRIAAGGIFGVAPRTVQAPEKRITQGRHVIQGARDVQQYAGIHKQPRFD